MRNESIRITIQFKQMVSKYLPTWIKNKDQPLGTHKKCIRTFLPNFQFLCFFIYILNDTVQIPTAKNLNKLKFSGPHRLSKMKLPWAVINTETKAPINLEFISNKINVEIYWKPKTHFSKYFKKHFLLVINKIKF